MRKRPPRKKTPARIAARKEQQKRRNKRRKLLSEKVTEMDTRIKDLQSSKEKSPLLTPEMISAFLAKFVGSLKAGIIPPVESAKLEGAKAVKERPGKSELTEVDTQRPCNSRGPRDAAKLDDCYDCSDNTAATEKDMNLLWTDPLLSQTFVDAMMASPKVDINRPEELAVASNREVPAQFQRWIQVRLQLLVLRKEM